MLLQRRAAAAADVARMPRRASPCGEKDRATGGGGTDSTRRSFPDSEDGRSDLD